MKLAVYHLKNVHFPTESWNSLIYQIAGYIMKVNS